MSKRLELLFENETGRTVTISLDDPVYPTNAATVLAAMNEVITQGAITSTSGDLVSVKGARIVERTVEEIV
ncbi:DUF2922 domain-containing protein [Bacillus alkalicellulosilyticus]|uniref:DUF2922 domain-containing protein n=1 Tax=Alkalihalobacterium alkalicellulosilyticum TaxID=1912214 RepID=UPI0009981540|nr:DUF2922 domain-containing protein [Bacillus alkalicellulosilyticus]